MKGPWRHRFPIDRRRCALLVLDMQNDFVHPAGAFPIAGVAAPLARQQELVECVRRLGRPVLFTRHVTDPAANPIEALLFPRAGEGHLARGSWGWEICDQLAPRPGEEVIDKLRFDAFLGTPLSRTLQEKKITDLVICGCQTQICCDTTARSAACRDYRVTLVGDACASRRPDLHEPALTLFAQAFGQVLRAGDIVA